MNPVRTGTVIFAGTEKVGNVGKSRNYQLDESSAKGMKILQIYFHFLVILVFWHPKTGNLFEQQGAFYSKGRGGARIITFSRFAIWAYVLK